MMEDIHPNLSLLKNLNLQDLDACRSILADNFVWHYFNRHIPDLEGDYRGVDGLKSFFAKLGERSDSSFRVNVIDIRTAGDELVVTQVCNSMNLEGSLMEFDAVVVWRIVNGQVAEAWDIPAVNTIRSVEKS
ncbi:nuclear transport factor 2 family protein [Neptunomonas sp.]|uniref:nuclear transport factor 2 family protein n=1 Tax=Neptunomonas sp. TaxID=1971898 RepID=UPI0035660EAB